MTDLASFYGSYYQQPLLLAVPTALWLLALLFVMKPRDDLWKYCVVVAALSIADASLTAGATAAWVSILFVILGDFRVFFITTPGSLSTKLVKALPLALIVPILSMALGRVLPSDWSTTSRIVFLTYELLFLGFFSMVTISAEGRKGFSNPMRAYPLAYYASWAVADVCLLASAEQSWAAWMLRIVANLLYYFGWTPWVWRFSRRPAGA